VLPDTTHTHRHTHCTLKRPAAAEALKKWDGGRAPRGSGEAVCLSLGCHPWKFLKNTGANLRSSTHFGLKIRILNRIIQTFTVRPIILTWLSTSATETVQLSA